MDARLIALLVKLGVKFIPGEERLIRACCPGALAVPQGGLDPDDFVQKVIDILQPEAGERLKRIHRSAKVLSVELRKARPSLEVIAGEAAVLVPELLPKDDARVQHLLAALKLLKNVAAVVENLRAAVDNFKKGDKEGAVENAARAAQAVGAEGLAKGIRDHKRELVWILGVLTWLGFAQAIGGDDQVEAEEDDCVITDVQLLITDGQQTGLLPAGSLPPITKGGVTSQADPHKLGPINNPQKLKINATYRYSLFVYWIGMNTDQCVFKRWVSRYTSSGVKGHPDFQEDTIKRGWLGAMGEANESDKEDFGPADYVYWPLRGPDAGLYALQTDVPGRDWLTKNDFPLLWMGNFYAVAVSKVNNATKGRIWYSFRAYALCVESPWIT